MDRFNEAAEFARYLGKAAAEEVKKDEEEDDKEEGQHESKKPVKMPKNLRKSDLARRTHVSAAGYKPFNLSYKWASAYGIKNLAVQENMPVAERRDITEEDKKKMQAGESRWFPRIFSSYGTPAQELLSSPAKGALLHGLGGALAGSLGGAALGSRLPDTNLDKILGASLIGGLGLGGLTGIGGYFSRKAQNEGIKDLMLRLPQGATKRDLLSDPVYNRDESMRKLRAISRLNDIHHMNAYNGLYSNGFSLNSPFASSFNKRAGLFYRDITPKQLMMAVDLPLKINGIGGDSSKIWPTGIVRNKEPRFLTRLFVDDPAEVPGNYLNYAANSVFDDIGGSLDHVRGGRKFDKKYNFGDYAALLSAHLLNKNVADNLHTGLKATHLHPEWGGPFLTSRPTKDLINLGIAKKEIYDMDPSDSEGVNKLVDKKFGKKRRVEESA